MDILGPCHRTPKGSGSKRSKALPPPSCQPTPTRHPQRDYHSALVAELSQGVKLLEAMKQYKTRSYTEDVEVRSAMDLKYNVLDGFRRESNRTLLMMNPQ